MITRVQTAANQPPTHKAHVIQCGAATDQASEARCGRACARTCGYSANNSHVLTHTFSIACRGQNLSRSAFTAHLRRNNDSGGRNAVERAGSGRLWWAHLLLTTSCPRSCPTICAGLPGTVTLQPSQERSAGALDQPSAGHRQTGQAGHAQRATTCESLGWPAWCPRPGVSCVPRTSSFRGTNALVMGQNVVSVKTFCIVAPRGVIFQAG